jgi:hypothetical protein
MVDVKQIRHKQTSKATQVAHNHKSFQTSGVKNKYQLIIRGIAVIVIVPQLAQKIVWGA